MQNAVNKHELIYLQHDSKHPSKQPEHEFLRDRNNPSVYPWTQNQAERRVYGKVTSRDLESNSEWTKKSLFLKASWFYKRNLRASLQTRRSHSAINPNARSKKSETWDPALPGRRVSSTLTSGSVARQSPTSMRSCNAQQQRKARQQTGSHKLQSRVKVRKMDLWMDDNVLCPSIHAPKRIGPYIKTCWRKSQLPWWLSDRECQSLLVALCLLIGPFWCLRFPTPNGRPPAFVFWRGIVDDKCAPIIV